MTSEGLGKMFEGDSADMCAGKFPLMLMGARPEGLACADPGACHGIANTKARLLKLSPSSAPVQPQLDEILIHKGYNIF